MRVLVVHNRYRSALPSGENAVVDEETQLLAEHGCTVERAEVSSDEIASWPAARRAALPARVVWSREGSRLVARAVARFRPDVVHFHNTFPLLSPAALRAAARSGAPVVQTLHNFRPLCPAATFLRDGRICEDCLSGFVLPSVRHGCYRGSRAATVPLAAMVGVHRALGTWVRSVDRFVAPSEFARAKYIEAGWPAERIAVKPNTVADPGIERAGRPSGFVCLSRLGPEKGIDTLLAAWAEAFPDGGEGLLVVGSGDGERELRATAGQVAGVVFTGQLPHDEALALVARSRALVLPSRCFEVFPRALVEAYALGVPVVASRLGSLAELVDDGTTGLLVEPGSPGALGTSLRAIANGSGAAADLGRAARRAYEERYSPSGTTARLLEIYADVTRERKVAA